MGNHLENTVSTQSGLPPYKYPFTVTSVFWVLFALVKKERLKVVKISKKERAKRVGKIILKRKAGNTNQDALFPSSVLLSLN